ncbi:MAG: pseudaminic acid synthase [Verrucomicrobiae bacterium]|nr:pseudaminic acid synthase [Verrucomicrobiae bacterium]
MSQEVHIAGRPIGPGHPVYVVAELSANHGGSFEQAAQTLRAMKEAGADAVKVQTYTADTLTLASDQPWFRIQGGTLWDGRTLHELYQQAAMPWEWTPRLQALAAELGLHFFSTPFDFSAVDYLQQLEVPAYKIASFELVDLPLLRKVAATGKPVIASTGMATLEEITEAVTTLRQAGARELALLKCTSAYPAPPEEMHLRTLPDLAARFQVPVGLSDHTLGLAAPVAAVALGACIIEKHFILSRSLPGPDSAFSLEPAEFQAMVKAIRETERALGRINYELSPQESKSRQFRRSLFVVEAMRAGEVFTPQNVRSLRPANGLHPRHYEEILGRRAACDIPRGTPLSWELIQPREP